MYKNYTKNWCALPWYTNQFLIITKLTIVLLIINVLKVDAALHGVDSQKRYKIIRAKSPIYSIMPDEITVIETKDYISKEILILQNQFLDIKGFVLDESGKPLPGVTVKVKGSSINTTTDPNGAFTLKNVDKNARLIISYIGYVSQEIDASDKISIKLLPDVNNLSEVVISVGYGTQEKAKITGAISTVSGEQLRKRTTTNNTTGLAGLIPGLVSLNTSGKPGTGSTISIRGQSSYNNASALFVIDGVVRSADSFAQLDPNEIENISVLKDAGSAAIYGVRSTNGVIVVTTKRGAFGKPIISFSSNVSFDKPTQDQKLLNAYEYATLKNEADVNMGATKLTFTPQQIEDYRTGLTPSTNWRSVAYDNKSAVTQQHNLTLNGASDAIGYFFSLGYTNQNGIYSNLNYKRYNFRSNIDVKINETLAAKINLEGRVVNNSAPNVSDNTLWQRIILLLPTERAYYPDGKPAFTPSAAELHVGEVTKKSGYNRANDNLFVGTLSLTQKLPFITEGLSATGSMNIYNQQIFNKVFNKQYSVYAEDPNGNITNTYNLGTKTTLSEEYQTGKSYTMNLSVDYNRVFGKHTVKAMVNYEQYQANFDNFRGSRTNFPFPSIDQLFAGSNDNERGIDGSGSEDGRIGIITRLNYDYESKYITQISFRNDASYRFAPDKRWGFFPAVSVGWVISKESFVKDNLTFIDLIKLRASYGLTGNDAVGGFQWKSSYGLSGDYYFSESPAKFLIQSAVPNPNITWEKTKEANLGLDINILKEQLGFTFDFFKKETYDIYASRINQYPGTYGASLPSVNYGKVDVQGFEFSLKHQKQIGQFRYGVSGNVSFNRNRVKQIDYTPNVSPWNNPIGKPINYTTGYKDLGLYQSDEEAAIAPRFEGTNPKAGDIRYADLNNDGIIDQRDISVINWYGGSPEIMYGFLIDASWKGLDLNIFLQGVANRTILLQDFARNILNNGNSYTYFLDRWTPDNRDATIPRAWAGSNPVNNVNSTFWLRNAGFLRLKNVQLGYTLPKPWVTKAKLSNIRLYVSGSNLFVFSKIKDFDPEFGGSGFYYPQNKSIVMGANVSF